mgnify:CR=1 FL=1
MAISHPSYSPTPRAVVSMWLAVMLAIVVALLLLIAVGASPLAAAEKISFKDDIHPIIQTRCLACHKPGGEGYDKSGLDLRTYEGLMKGTKHGPIVIPGEAFTSNLNVLIEGRADKGIRMPHGKRKLTSCDKDLFRRWVNQGAANN